MCGAGQVLGLDIDSEAIESARSSLSLNQARGSLNLQAKIDFQKVPEHHEDAFDFVDSIRVKDLQWERRGGASCLEANQAIKKGMTTSYNIPTSYSGDWS